MNKYKNSHSAATTAYNTRSTIGFTIRLNVKTDADIIEKINACENRNALIKRLLRSALDESVYNGWVDNFVEDSNDDDGGHYNGVICPRCRDRGTARPHYKIYSFCPDCGLNMFPQRGRKPKIKKAKGGTT